jgi:hypothetical protein
MDMCKSGQDVALVGHLSTKWSALAAKPARIVGDSMFLSINIVQKYAILWIGLTGTELGIIAKQGHTIGTDNRVCRNHLEINMRMIMGC